MQQPNDQYNSNIGNDSSKSALSAADVFAQDQFGLFVYKKTEKMTAALYMITALIKDSEPLKWAIRDDALELLAAGLSYAGAQSGDRMLFSKDLSGAMLRTLSLLEVGARSRIISEMNTAVMRREFEALLADIRKEEIEGSGSMILSESFFSVPRSAAPNRSEIALPFSETHSQLKQTEQRGDQLESKGQQITQSPNHSVTNRDPRIGARAPMINGARQQALSAPRIKDKNRQELIVATLKKYKNRKLGIKDFAQVIVGCSEKTIQRELLELAEKGVLKKEGERRWSTYYLSE